MGVFSQTTVELIKSNYRQNKILVVGDVMLDRYYFGEVNRISPEAPVPIAKINRIDDRPGGAANVARNIASLGGNVTLLSVVGEDEPATILANLLAAENVKSLFKVDNKTSTIVKLRVIARTQQLIRLDFETPPSHEVLAELTETFSDIINDYDLVILSDYGKGGLDHAAKMISIAKRYSKKVLVDPKGNDYSKYTNATLITPNLGELREAVGKWNNEQDFITKAQQLKAKLNLEYLLVTKSEDGMTLFGQDVNNYPTFAQQVFDVSGAGDTVIATLGLMLAQGTNITDAVKMANLAAGIVVGKLGTATVTKAELINKLNEIKA